MAMETVGSKSDAMRAMFQSMADRAAANPAMDLAALRDMMEELQFLGSEPEDVRYAETSAGGVPALWCFPEGAADDRVVLYTHGGGFVTNSVDSHRKVVGHLSKALGIRGLSLEYRRAPESSFPAQVDDFVAAYRWLLDQGIAAEHIVLSGDSAGGNLATGGVLALRDRGLPAPAAVIAFSPWYDMELVGPTMDSNAPSDVFVQRPILDAMAGYFLGESGSRTDPVANPLHGDLAGFPPVYLTAGGDETLLSDSQRFAEKTTAAGGEAVLRVVDGMQHIFVMMAGRAPEADDVIAEAARWARPKLGLA